MKKFKNFRAAGKDFFEAIFSSFKQVEIEGIDISDIGQLELPAHSSESLKLTFLK